MQSSHVSCRRLQFRASASVMTEESQIFLDAYSSFSIVTSPDALMSMKIYDLLFVLANYFCLQTWSNLSISVKKKNVTGDLAILVPFGKQEWQSSCNDKILHDFAWSCFGVSSIHFYSIGVPNSQNPLNANFYNKNIRVYCFHGGKQELRW